MTGVEHASDYPDFHRARVRHRRARASRVGGLGRSRRGCRCPDRRPGAIAAQADRQDVNLARQRGGTDTHNDARIDGAVTANTAVNVVTGANSIDAGSFANMAGIPVVIQNSGANVLIQNATIINLQFK
jgi:hypothetical protein